MARYLICLSAASGSNPANYVVNTIEWDGVSAYSPPAGTTLVADAAAIYQPGDTYGVTPVRASPAPVRIRTQAASMQTWIQQQANLAAAMGEIFTSDMKSYVTAINAIASGTDTTSTALPAQPTDVMTASTATTTTGTTT